MKPRTETTLYRTLIFMNSLMLSFGIARVFMITNGIQTSVLSVLIPVVVVHLVIRLFFDPPIRILISLSGLILLTLLFFLLAPQALMPLRQTLFEFISKATFTVQYFIGQAAAEQQMLPFAVTAAVSLISLLVYATSIHIQLPLLWAAVLLAMMTLNTLREVKQDSVGLFFASVAILILLVKRQPFRQEDGRRPNTRQPVTAMMVAFPMILAAMIGSMILTPLLPIRMGRQQQFLEGIADDVSQALGIEPTQTLQPDFSIGLAGFYPLGTRLGGPVTLTNSPVMNVSGHQGTMLLRGAIYERYDGKSWARDPRGPTYRLDNAFQTDLKTQVFDLDQPDPDVVSGGVVSGLIADSQLTIIPLPSISSMIFTPGRPLSIDPRTGDRFQVYYDDHGMLYSKYALTTRNVYDVTSTVLKTGERNFSSSVSLALGLGGPQRVPRETLYAADYLTLPTTVHYRANGILKTLADRLTSGLNDPYAKALAIRRYLIDNATYNLNVAVPPADRDFVVWFLETKEGYCVYFATAEVILCRLAGIPARYVEGFILDNPTQLNGTTTVTADWAHAWSEIYVPYIGWVPVDATPGATIPGDDIPEPTPVPTSGETDVTVTDPSDVPIDPDEIVDPDVIDNTIKLLIELLAGLLVAVLIFVTWLVVRNRIRILRFPEKLRQLYPDPAFRAEIYWQELQILFSQDGLILRNGETPIQFLSRVRERWPGREGRLAETGRLISSIRYGRHVPRETELAMLGSLLAQIEESNLETRAVKHFFRHLLLPRLHGVDRRRRLIRDHFVRAAAVRLSSVFKT